MASVEIRHPALWLATAVVWFLCAVASGNEEHARNYQNFINNVRQMVSHPYRDHTNMMTGSRAVSFVPLGPLVGGVTTSSEILFSHRDFYILGYRTIENGQRVVYLLTDSDANSLTQGTDYDRLERLRFGGSYSELERYAGRSRQRVEMTVQNLQDHIRLLDQPPDRNTNEQRALAMMTLVMVVSEAARNNEIFNAVHDTLRNGDVTGTTRSGVAWRPTDRLCGLMNNWFRLSTFIFENSQQPSTTSQWFPALNQDVTVSAALAMIAIMARCIHNPNRSRRQTTPAECGIGAAVNAALADGPNNVYLFNGPNFVNVRFTPGTTDDRIVGSVKSIYSEWSFLRNTPFVDGIDSAFRVPGSNNAYIFKGEYYALIDVGSKSIINGPKTIYSSWPSLRPYSFVNGIDAVFASKRENEIYMFRNGQYALVNYAPGTTNDWIINGPEAIGISWPSLRGTIFEYGFDASFARPDITEAYLFKGDTYALVNYAPGTTNDRIVNGPLKIRDGWPSLRGTAFDV